MGSLGEAMGDALVDLNRRVGDMGLGVELGGGVETSGCSVDRKRSQGRSILSTG